MTDFEEPGASVKPKTDHDASEVEGSGRPDQARIDELTYRMLELYYAFEEKESESHSLDKLLEAGDSDVQGLRLDLEDGLYCVRDLLILLCYGAQLRRLLTLPMGEIPQAAEQVKDALRHYTKWMESHKQAEFRLSGSLIERARQLGVSWQAIGDAIGMSAQGAYRKGISSARLRDETPPPES